MTVPEIYKKPYSIYEEKPFVDKTFPHDYHSVWGFGVKHLAVSSAEFNKINWKRPDLLFGRGSTYYLYNGEPEPEDVVQGMLGMGPVTAAIAGIAEKPERIKRLFTSKE